MEEDTYNKLQTLMVRKIIIITVLDLNRQFVKEYLVSSMFVY